MDEDQTLANTNEAQTVEPRRPSRRRLLTLLLLLIVLGGTLGGWHVYANYVAPHVEAVGPAEPGKPLVIRGGYVDLFGFDSEVVTVEVSEVLPDGQTVLCQSAKGRANRSGLWSYDFEIKLDEITKGGEYDIQALPLTRAVHARRTPTDADSIWGKMTVSQPK